MLFQEHSSEANEEEYTTNVTLNGASIKIDLRSYHPPSEKLAAKEEAKTILESFVRCYVLVCSAKQFLQKVVDRKAIMDSILHAEDRHKAATQAIKDFVFTEDIESISAAYQVLEAEAISAEKNLQSLKDSLLKIEADCAMFVKRYSATKRLVFSEAQWNFTDDFLLNFREIEAHELFQNA